MDLLLRSNVYHPAGAQNMQAMAEWGTELEVVAESYWVPDSLDCVADATSTVVIVRRESTTCPSLRVLDCVRGFVLAAWGKLGGGYAPLSRSLENYW